MKRLIKYPLALLFALLMGSSQVFAYLAPSPTKASAGSEERVHQAQAGTLATEIALVGEIEEDENDRPFHPDGSASPFLLQTHLEPHTHLAQTFRHYPFLSSFPDTYIRFRAIRL